MVKSPQMAYFLGRGHQPLRDAIVSTTKREFYTPKGEPPSLKASCHWIGKTPGSPESTSELPDNECPSTYSDNANGLDSSSDDKGDDRSSGDDNDDNSDAGL